jgi:hypothetical protein
MRTGVVIEPEKIIALFGMKQNLFSRFVFVIYVLFPVRKRALWRSRSCAERFERNIIFAARI